MQHDALSWLEGDRGEQIRQLGGVGVVEFADDLQNGTRRGVSGGDLQRTYSVSSVLESGVRAGIATASRGVVVETVAEVVQQTGQSLDEGLRGLAGMVRDEGAQGLVPVQGGAVPAGACFGEAVGIKQKGVTGGEDGGGGGAKRTSARAPTRKPPGVGRAALPSLLERVEQTHPTTDLGTPVVEQLAAALLNEHQTQRPDTLQQLRSQRDALREALTEHLPDVHALKPVGGVTLWATFPGPVSSRLAAMAPDHGVTIAAGPRFGIGGAFERNIRLPCTLPSSQLIQAIRRLA